MQTNEEIKRENSTRTEQVIKINEEAYYERLRLALKNFGDVEMNLREFIDKVVAQKLADREKELCEEIEKIETFAIDDYCITKDPKCETLVPMVKLEDVLDLITKK